MTEGRRLSRAIAVALAIAERLVDEALAPASGRALVQPGALAMNRCCHHDLLAVGRADFVLGFHDI